MGRHIGGTHPARVMVRHIRWGGAYTPGGFAGGTYPQRVLRNNPETIVPPGGQSNALVVPVTWELRPGHMPIAGIK